MARTRLKIVSESSITVTIQDQSGTGRVGATTVLDGIAPTITLRDLIRTRVREEVARHNAKPGQLFQGLVMPEGAEQVERGYRIADRRWISWERQADRAIEAFGHNGFFVLVDDHQVDDLDAELDLAPATDIRFVRLVQLIGG